jgi:hypothetical protein
MNKHSARRKAFATHIRRIQKHIQQFEADRNRLARYRPIIFFLGAALAYWLGWMPFIVAVLLIGIEALYYNRIGKVINRRQLWLAIKSTQLARMNLDWEHIPEPPLKAPIPNHPFENDLDITGPRSLHHLIDTAISREGSQRLRDWLLQKHPDPQRIETRQQIIRELVPLAGFRDKLALNFALVSKDQLDGEKLLRWLRVQSSSHVIRRVLSVSFVLAIINLALFLGYRFGWIPGYWIISLAAYLVVYFMNQSALKESFDAVMLLYDELTKFKTILRYLETYAYGKNTHLRRLCEPFLNRQTLPSAQLRKITWLVTGISLRVNPVLGLFLNLVVPWDFFFAERIDRCKARFTTLFPEWVNAWSELEALVSLANFAYLHPEYVFPEIIMQLPTLTEACHCEERSDEAISTSPPTPPRVGEGKEEGCFAALAMTQPIFQATAMGHPLIPAAQKVCNDLALHTLGEIILITGSNMAGKSTFLKTVGINLCLAYAGGPVNAQTFRTRLFRLFTCMQIHDSITDGFSFFYAEVKRLKALLEALHDGNQIPVLFLIDEIFRGTNSRERLIGSRAYIHHLSSQPGVGLIATHDLELGQLEAQIPGLKNFHFRDDVKEGKMIFDYKLYPGLCPTTNALKIMRMEGLPVES